MRKLEFQLPVSFLGLGVLQGPDHVSSRVFSLPVCSL